MVILCSTHPAKSADMLQNSLFWLFLGSHQLVMNQNGNFTLYLSVQVSRYAPWLNLYLESSSVFKIGNFQLFWLFLGSRISLGQLRMIQNANFTFYSSNQVSRYATCLYLYLQFTSIFKVGFFWLFSAISGYFFGLKIAKVS